MSRNDETQRKEIDRHDGVIEPAAHRGVGHRGGGAIRRVVSALGVVACMILLVAVCGRGGGSAYAQPGAASASASASTSSKPAPWSTLGKGSASASASASAPRASASAPPAKPSASATEKTAKPAPSASEKPAPPEPNPGEPTVDAKANAEALFNRGNELLDKKEYAEACPLLAESLRLDFALGTLLYLSDCQEKLGQTASAWAGFKKAEAIAKKRGEVEREQKAHEHVVALEPKLAMLKISVADANKSIGIVVKRNGIEVGAPAWGQPLPVDPGEQKLEATAPGYKSWSTTVDVPQGSGETEASIPALEKAPDIVKPGTGGGLNIDGKAMRIAGLTIGGAGLVGLILGTGFGIDAIKTYDDAIATCQNGDTTKCTPDGVQLQHDASRSATISTVTFSLGAIMLGGGALLFFLAPKTAAPKVGAWIDSNGFFLSFGGAL